MPVQTISLKDMDAVRLTIELIKFDESLIEAIDFASAMHIGQTRREAVSGRVHTPYIEHVLRVTLRLVRLGITDYATIRTALFHDVVEDCVDMYQQYAGLSDAKVAREELRQYISQHFGQDTLDGVDGVTLPEVDPAIRVSQTREERNQSYFEHVKESVHRNFRSCLAKISDFLDNAGSLHHAPMSRQVFNSAVKYLPMCDVFIERLASGDLPISDTIAGELISKLELTRHRLERIIETGSYCFDVTTTSDNEMGGAEVSEDQEADVSETNNSITDEDDYFAGMAPCSCKNLPLLAECGDCNGLIYMTADEQAQEPVDVDPSDLEDGSWCVCSDTGADGAGRTICGDCSGMCYSRSFAV